MTVKICGITNLPDAMAAAKAGADALGFVFCPSSPRAVTLEQVEAIARELPSHIARVGVFVNTSVAEVSEAIAKCGLNIAQFHGEEPPEYCLQFGIMSMKAFRVRDRQSLEQLPLYHTDAWLLDAYNPVQRGGSGETFDWELAAEAASYRRPIFLAGGLNPGNVALAICQAKPFGVDVSSGVEQAPGRKDHAKVRDFIQAAKAASLA